MKPARGLAALIAAPALLVTGVTGALLLTPPPPPPAASCGPAGAVAPVDLASLPTGAVAGYKGVQLANAAAIVNAALALGLDAHGQTIGVMTAMGESQLKVVDHGDAAGPDSRGLFQQRANGAWGSYADRMDPTTSATNFFRALAKVPIWNTLTPTIAAHRVQGNADPYYYEPFWGPAGQVVAALAGAPPASPSPSPSVVNANLTAPAPGPGDPACLPAVAVGLSTGGWTKPAVGPITSPYGMRMHPVYHVLRLHTGTDLGAPCRAPIMDAHDGVVVGAGPVSGYGNLITVDHGGGIVTRYAHMFNDGVLVRVGDQVKAGQQIARVGSNGVGTACHLHFEVRINGAFTDPAPFMIAHGAPLGT